MSDRVLEANERALERLRNQRRQLAPLRACVVIVAFIATFTSHPFAGHTGKGVGIVVCLVLFCGALLLWPRSGRGRNYLVFRASVVVIMIGTSIALAGLQPNGASELPASATVFIAGTALATEYAVAVGLVVIIGMGIALQASVSVSSLFAAVLLCAVLGVTGALLRQARVSEANTELLLVELEDARDDQAHAAAMEERAAIARELHDVLAHSLSGLAVQLEGARQLARKDGASEQLIGTIDAASALAKEGLIEARDAVSALRNQSALGLDQLTSLISHFQESFDLMIDMRVTGEEHPIAQELSLALYRIVGESLTNVARHAPGANTTIDLVWSDQSVHLAITDAGSDLAPSTSGGGFGITGMRERVQRLGGTFDAGPTTSGWTVKATVPT